MKSLVGNSPFITDQGIACLARLANLETLSLTSFDAITDKSINALVMKLKQLSNLCLRDNCKLTIRTLEACVEVANANPNHTLNVHLDEKQVSAGKLFMKCATNLIRHKWEHILTGEEQEQFERATRRRGSLSGQQQIQRWPNNLKVVIDEKLR